MAHDMTCHFRDIAHNECIGYFEILLFFRTFHLEIEKCLQEPERVGGLFVRYVSTFASNIIKGLFHV